MKLIICLIVATFGFLLPPFIFYFFIHDSGWELVLRCCSFIYFLGIGLLFQRYGKRLSFWYCILYAFLSLITLFLFPFVFEYVYRSNLNLNNSSAIRTWSAISNGSFLRS